MPGVADDVVDTWVPILPVPALMEHLRENLPDLISATSASSGSTRPRRSSLGARLDEGAVPLDAVVAAILGRPPASLVEEFRALPVRPAAMAAWLSGNAARPFAETGTRRAR